MKNIILIGFVCSGKTSIGKELAKQINYNFIDIKEKIADVMNMSWIQLNQRLSIKQLNDLEQATINELRGIKRTIIELDSLALINDINIRILNHNGYFIWLKTDIQDVIKNIIYDETQNRIFRFTLNNYSKANHFEKCMQYAKAQRAMIDYEAFYRDNADLIVDVHDKSINLLTNNIIQLLINKYIIKKIYKD